MPPEDDVGSEEEDDEDLKEDPADYLIDKDGDDEEEESFEDEDESEKEEEHLALSDSATCHTYSAIITTHPLSSPLPRIPSPPFPVPLTTRPTDAGAPLGYRFAMIRLRAESPSTSHPLPPPIVLPCTRASMVMMRVVAPSTYILAPRSETPPSGTPPLLPTSSPPLLLPFTNCRADVLEVMLPPQKRLLMSGQLNLLRRDMRSHAHTARLMESEARASREAWVRALQTMILAHQTEIKDLRAADRRRQAQLAEVLTLLGTLQTHIVAL
nr:hypothetical protein [Tanacetum cinerariifolium]